MRALKHFIARDVHPLNSVVTSVRLTDVVRYVLPEPTRDNSATLALLARELNQKAMIVGRHALEVDFDGVVTRYVCSASHAQAARADLHVSAFFRFRQDEKMAAFGAGFWQRRHDGGVAADRRTVATVAEVEDGEVKSLTVAGRDTQRRAFGGTAGQTSSVIRRPTITNQITAAERTIDRPRTRCSQLVIVTDGVNTRACRSFH